MSSLCKQLTKLRIADSNRFVCTHLSERRISDRFLVLPSSRFPPIPPTPPELSIYRDSKLHWAASSHNHPRSQTHILPYAYSTSSQHVSGKYPPICGERVWRDLILQRLDSLGSSCKAPGIIKPFSFDQHHLLILFMSRPSEETEGEVFGRFEHSVRDSVLTPAPYYSP